MNEHFNKETHRYRYKKYTKISKEFIKIHMFIHKMGDNYYIPENGIEYHYIKFDYKPYFLYRLFWYVKRKIIKIIPTKNDTRKNVISELIMLIIGTIIGTIISYYFLKFVFMWI